MHLPKECIPIPFSLRAAMHLHDLCNTTGQIRKAVCGKRERHWATRRQSGTSELATTATHMTGQRDPQLQEKWQQYQQEIRDDQIPAHRSFHH